MTIAISLKVNDGLVLAADSAATLMAKDNDGHTIVTHVYNHANKIVNLRKGLPIGFIVWGAGSIGTASIATLTKDLRKRFSSVVPGFERFHIDSAAYTIEAVAGLVREFLFDEHCEPTFRDWQGEKPSLGCIVAGYSTGDGMAEEYQILVTPDGVCHGPQLLRPRDDCGISWNGEPEAIHRLIRGYGTMLPSILENGLQVPADQIGPAMSVIGQALQAELLTSPMPIQDAIDLAEFLVDLTIRWSRFTPGAATVGGPIEVAAITKHEGFKWVRRKYYYRRELNPEGGDDGPVQDR